MPSKKGPQKCPVYLKIPWIGNTSPKFLKQLKAAVSTCNRATELLFVFAKSSFPTVYKYVEPFLRRSDVVYDYVCRCDCWYVDRTSQRLQDRIKQRIPKSISLCMKKETQGSLRKCRLTSPPPPPLNVTWQLDDIYWKIRILPPFTVTIYSQCWARSSFHLSTLEAALIKNKQPELCHQKEFIHALQSVF